MVFSGAKWSGNSPSLILTRVHSAWSFFESDCLSFFFILYQCQWIKYSRKLCRLRFGNARLVNE